VILVSNFHNNILALTLSYFAKGWPPLILNKSMHTRQVIHMSCQHVLAHMLTWRVSHCPYGKTRWCGTWVTCHMCVDLVKINKIKLLQKETRVKRPNCNLGDQKCNLDKVKSKPQYLIHFVHPPSTLYSTFKPNFFYANQMDSV
jgi:hypothetical protein